MRAVDTNVLVRLLVRDDPHQVAAAEAFVASGAWVSTVVLAETVWVLTAVYELEAKELAQLLGMLLEHEQLVLEHADAIAAALEAFSTRRRRTSLTDCLVLELARKAGRVPLGTFDRDLAKLDGAQRVG